MRVPAGHHKVVILSAFLIALFLSANAQAGTHLWNGSVGDGLWSSAGNWPIGGVPTSGESGGTMIVFSSNFTSNMNIAGLVVDFIQFTGTNSNITGSTLGINGNVLTTNIQNDTGTNTISCPLRFSANAAILVTVNAGSLNLTGNISSAAGSNGLILNGGTLTIGGAAVNSYTGKTNVVTGLLQLNSSSATAIPGELDIGQVNGAAGAATVRLLAPSEIADTSNVVVNTSGVFDLNGHGETIGTLDVAGGSVTFGGAVSLTVNGATSIEDGSIAIAAGTLSLQSTLSMSGGSITATTGTLALGGDVMATSSATSGATITINGGGSTTLNATTRTFTVTTGPTQPELAMNCVIANGTVTSGIKKSGTGTMDLLGSSNNLFTGTTTVDKGVVRMNTTIGHIINGPVIIGNSTDPAGSAILRELVQSNDVSNTSAVAINSSGVFDLASEIDTFASLTGTGSVTLGTNGELSVGDATNFTYDGIITGSATTSLTKLGTGVMTLTNNNSYGMTIVANGELDLNDNTGGTAISGNLQIGDGIGAANSASVVLLAPTNTQIPATSAITVNSDGLLNVNGKNFSTNSMTVNGGNVSIGTGTLTLQAKLTMTGGTISATTGVLNLGGAITATSSATTGAAISSKVALNITPTISVASGAVQPEFSITNIIIDGSNGPQGIFKNGAGTLALTNAGANTFSGTTTVDQGIVTLNSSVGVIFAGNIIIGNATDAANSAVVRELNSSDISSSTSIKVNASGLLDFNTHVDSIGALTGSGNVATASSFSVGNDNSTSVFDGVISGTGNFTKNGTGTFTLTGNNTLTNNTVVSAGTLVVKGSQPSSAVQVNTGGTLSGSGTVGATTITNSTLAPAVSTPTTLNISGNLIFAGTSTLKMTVNSISPGGFDNVNVTGTVTLGNATLTLSFAPTFISTGGTKLTLINNDAADAISGTFTGVAEGQLFTAGTQKLLLSYAGGNGNDVDLTAQNVPPVIATAAMASPASVGTGQTVNFSVAATDANLDSLTYTWDFGDSAAGSGASPTHAYAATGVYNVSVTANDGHGGTIMSNTSVTVIANTPPVISAAAMAMPSPAMVAQTVTFTVAATDVNLNTLTYTWNFGDNMMGAGASTTHAYLATGTYNVSVLVDDGQGGTVTSNTSVVVNPSLGGVGIQVPPVITSAAMATPSSAGVGQVVSFLTAASDANFDVLTYTWNFGDSTTGSGASTSHAYLAAGTYNVNVTVDDGHGGTVMSSTSVTVKTPIVGEGNDSDGDGFSDSFETAVGSSPTDGSTTPTGQPASAISALPAVKLAIKLNFARGNSDSILLSGSVAIPAGFSAANQKIAFALGGVVHSFTLNSKGAGTDAKNSFKLAFKSTKGAVPAQTAKYSLKLTAGSFAAALASDGLTNATIKSSTPTLPISLIVNKTLFQLSRQVQYKAMKGKTGSAK